MTNSPGAYHAAENNRNIGHAAATSTSTTAQGRRSQTDASHYIMPGDPHSCCDPAPTVLSGAGICLIVLGYTMFGAFTFMTLENGGRDSVQSIRSGQQQHQQSQPQPQTQQQQQQQQQHNQPQQHQQQQQQHQQQQQLQSQYQLARNDKLRAQTVEKLWKITEDLNILYRDNWTRLAEEEILKFQDSLIRKYGGPNQVDRRHRWNFASSFLYSLTLITTIGYGNVTPRTLMGKLVTILYAIVGMPLFLLYLSNIGDILAKSFKWIYAKCCLCRNCKKRRKRMLAIQRKEQWKMDMRDFKLNTGVLTEGEESDDEGTTDGSSSLSFNDTQEVTVPILLCLFIMVGYVSGGAILFSKWESWEFFDGSYFCFISLSTIGFGDFVPGNSITGPETSPGTGTNPSTGTFTGFRTSSGTVIELSFILCSMYLMLGMALIAMCFNLMQQDVVMKIRTCTDILRRISRCKN